MTRPGRRRGNPDTRSGILLSAKSLFAVNGYTATSIRQVAAAAGVDPALIHHYFASKQQLFLATLAVEVDIPSKLAAVAAAGANDFGRNLLTTFLSVWDSPASESLQAAVRTALADPPTGRIVREFLTTTVLATLAQVTELATDEGPRRAALIGSQLLGIVVGRYLLQLEPLATMPAEQLISDVAPTIQRYLTGPLDSADLPRVPATE